jgi:AraC-like DNA-binding protein
MHGVKISGDDVPDPLKRMGEISNAISDIFASHWRAAPIDNNASAFIDLSLADGVALSHAQMSAMTLDNRASGDTRNLKFSAYIVDQPQIIRLGTGESLRVQPRELLILRSDLPCRIMTAKAYTTTGLVIDADLFEHYVPDYQGVIARRLFYPFGIDDLLSSSLDSCVALSRAGRFEEIGPRITRSFLELLAVVACEKDVDPEVRRSTSLDIRCSQVKSFIDKHFRDPDLTISSIAQRLHLTPRYVQLAFEGQDHTPSEYLRKRRMEACAGELLDRSGRRKSVTEIAFSNGFNSSSHFSTEFKRVHGMTPREWRLSEGAADSDTPAALDLL